MLCLGYFCIRAAYDPSPQDYNSFVVGDCLCPENVTGGECQPGYYCPEGSNEPTSCEEGKYCATPALADVTGDCDPGFYCARGASRADPTDGVTGDVCPVGRYCGTISPKHNTILIQTSNT